MQLTMTTPLRTAAPNSAMKPIAAETLSGMPVSSSANTPPTSANGTLSRISAACCADWKAWNSSTKIRKMLSGTISRSRAIARCWFSNSPPQTSRAPGARCTLPATRRCISSTALPMSRPRMNTPIAITRLPDSRLMFIAPAGR